MAKTRRTPSAKSSFEFNTLSSKDASERRSQRGKRRSKYSAVGEKFEALKNDEVLVFQASKNEVQGVRNYMRRNFEDEHKVYSRRSEGDTFEIHISKAS